MSIVEPRAAGSPNKTSQARMWFWAVLAALILTIVNLAKPAVVDDTAYLEYATQFAAHPATPYDFTFYWYDKPQPAMATLVPPVLPYWLALGIRLFGAELFVVKLWLFPVLLIFTASVATLLRRFSGEFCVPIYLCIVCGPAAMPFVNVMLDLPALGLQCAAIALVLHAPTRPKKTGAVFAASACLALAIETKYSTLGLPVVLVLLGFWLRMLKPAIVCVAIGVLFVVLIEMAIHLVHGESHFLHHLLKQSETERRSFAEIIAQTQVFIDALAGYLGVCACWIVGIVVARFGLPASVSYSLMAVYCVLFCGVLFAPNEWTVYSRVGYTDRVTLAHLVFLVSGWATLGIGLILAIVQTVRQSGHSPITRFLLCWLIVELSAYFVLSPFPAGRRVLGVSLVLGLIVAMPLGREISPRLSRLTAVCTLSIALVFTLYDAQDASAEKAMIQELQTFAEKHALGPNCYFHGHWGFQYYATRAGWNPLVAEQSTLQPGDWIALPIFPDPVGFYRPHDGDVRLILPHDSLRKIGSITVDDWLPATTVPTLYGGTLPIVPRHAPRLHVAIYQVKKRWEVQAEPTP